MKDEENKIKDITRGKEIVRIEKLRKLEANGGEEESERMRMRETKKRKME